MSGASRYRSRSASGPHPIEIHRLRLSGAARRRRNGHRRRPARRAGRTRPVPDHRCALHRRRRRSCWRPRNPADRLDLQPEGRFGEFTRLMGRAALKSHWCASRQSRCARTHDLLQSPHAVGEHLARGANPLLRGDPPGAQDRGRPRSRPSTSQLGGCCLLARRHLDQETAPARSKNALLAALSVMDVKHVVVVDDDIDVFDPNEVEWAIATRVPGRS